MSQLNVQAVVQKCCRGMLRCAAKWWNKNKMSLMWNMIPRLFLQINCEWTIEWTSARTTVFRLRLFPVTKLQVKHPESAGRNSMDMTCCILTLHSTCSDVIHGSTINMFSTLTCSILSQIFRPYPRGPPTVMSVHNDHDLPIPALHQRASESSRAHRTHQGSSRPSCPAPWRSFLVFDRKQICPPSGSGTLIACVGVPWGTWENSHSSHLWDPVAPWDRQIPVMTGHNTRWSRDANVSHHQISSRPSGLAVFQLVILAYPKPKRDQPRRPKPHSMKKMRAAKLKETKWTVCSCWLIFLFAKHCAAYSYSGWHAQIKKMSVQFSFILLGMNHMHKDFTW